MDRVNPELDEVFERALEDARIAREDVDLAALDEEPDPTGQPVRYIPRGTPIPGDLTLTGEQAETLKRSRRPHRLAVSGKTDAALLLALVRWGLDAARQNEGAPAAWRFAWTVMDAGVSEAHAGLAGGGVVHNLLPPVRDGNLAAARLVTATYGPQVGRLHGPWGSLFRVERDLGGIRTLAPRCVILTAVYRPWLDRRMGSPEQTAAFVEQCDADARTWWELLTADPTLEHVTGVIELMAPTEADLLEHQDAPAQAWRPLAHVLGRALAHGLEVLHLTP